MPKDARNKLRSMGGIMASSPELMQAAAQRYQAGGNISVRPPGAPNTPSPLPTIPVVPPMAQPSLGPQRSGYAPGLLPTGIADPRLGGAARRAPLSPTQARENAALERLLMEQRMDGPLTAGGGARQNVPTPAVPFEPRVPMGPEAGQPERMDARVLANVLAGEESLGEEAGVTVDDLVSESGAATFKLPETRSAVSAGEAGAPRRIAGPQTAASTGADTPTPRQQESAQFRSSVFDMAKDFYEGPVSDIAGFAQQGFGLGLDALGGAASILGMDSVSAELERQSDRLYNQAASNIRQGVSATAELDPAQFDMEPEQFRRVIAAAEAAEEARQEAASNIDRKMTSDAAATQRQLEELVPASALDPKNVQKATKIVNDELRSGEDTGAEAEAGDSDGTDGPAPAPTKRDLRSRYKEKIELFKEIYGESDEERARDKAMSLAMLGLAIAAGQSPDALTNIAQGAMVGLQGMSEQEKARREQEQAVQTLALESAMGDIESEAAAEEARLDRQARLRAAAMRSAGGGSTYTANRLYQTTLDNIMSNPNEFPVFDENNNFDIQKARQLAAQAAGIDLADAPAQTVSLDQVQVGQAFEYGGETFEKTAAGTYKREDGTTVSEAGMMQILQGQ